MAKSTFLKVQPGAIVGHSGRTYRVTHLLGMDAVLAAETSTGRSERLEIGSIGAPDADAEAAVKEDARPDLSCFPKEAWEVAQERMAIIKPLLDAPARTRAMVEKAAEAADLHPSTLYEWMKDFQGADHMSVLIPRKRGRKEGTRLLDEKVEAVLSGIINRKYLGKQRLTPEEIYKRVETECDAAGLPKPHSNTVRNRIRDIPAPLVLRRRGQRDVARNLHEPIRGHFPDPGFPLSVVQIDHTPANIIVVDALTRRPAGKPTLTLAIDVATRMVVGLNLSKSAPSAALVGRCLVKAMLPKTAYLAGLGVEGDWPVWGKMRVVHADNAKEFRGKVIGDACKEHMIDLQWRPVATPHWGGHIERLMGTVATEIHTLPGTTFANPQKRKGYKSEKEACMTIEEVERHLVDFFVNEYHVRKHSEIGMPPLEAWRRGIEGVGDSPGTGLPDMPVDPERLRLDFTPYERRFIKPYGVVIDDIHYWDEVLTPFINVKNKKSDDGRFTFRRDPDDISQVSFWHPSAEQYFAIPYRDLAGPPMSLADLKEEKRHLESTLQPVDEKRIFESRRRRERNVEEAQKTTRTARRRKGFNGRVDVSAAGAKRQAMPAPERIPADIAELFATPVVPFDSGDP